MNCNQRCQRFLPTHTMNQSDAASGALISAKETAEIEKESERLETLLWKLFESSFGIDPSDVKRNQIFLMDNRLEIALEKWPRAVLDGPSLQGQGAGAATEDSSGTQAEPKCESLNTLKCYMINT